MISADAYIDTPVGKSSSLQISARKSLSEFLETPTYNRYFDKAFQDTDVVEASNEVFISDDDFTFYDTSVRWLYKISPRDHIRVNGLLMRNKISILENGRIDAVNIARESSVEQHNNAGGLAYTRSWNTDTESEILLYGTLYNLQAINSDIENNQVLLQENEVLEGGLKLKTGFKIKDYFTGNVGYQYNETGMVNLRSLNNPLFFERNKDVVRTQSLFSDFSFQSLNKKTNIKLGGRLNTYNKFDIINLEPRFSFSHGFKKYFTIEVLGELKSQVASQIIESQNDFLGVENRKWVLANEEEVPLITSRQISAGLNYKRKKWFIDGDVYYKKVKGILSDGQGFQNQLEFESTHGAYSVYGVDFLANAKINDWTFWLSYSFAKNDYTFNTIEPSEFPNNLDIRNQMNLGVSYTMNRFKFSSGLSWHSGRPTTSINLDDPLGSEGVINYQNPNGGFLKDYLRWDTSLTYSFPWSNTLNSFFGISVWNLLDAKNVVNEYYTLDVDEELDKIEELGLSLIHI